MRDRRARETSGKSREREPSPPEHAPRSPDAQRLLELQRTVGNAAVARLIAAAPASRRLAREEEAPGEEALPLDELAAGGSYTLSLAGIGDGIPIDSFSVSGSGGRGKIEKASVTRRPDKHSTAIQQAGATGKAIASAEVTAKVRSGTLSVKMQNVLVTSYTVSESESFTLAFTDFSVERT